MRTSVFIMLAFGLTATARAVPFPLEVESARPLASLNASFQQTSGWTGGDGAYSTRLGQERILWLFADSYIGKIADGRRVEMQFINNAFAWQPGDAAKPWRFFWREQGERAGAVLAPSEPSAWYWPADAVLIQDRLLMFCKKVRRQAGGPPGLQFEWFGNDLLVIDNPQDEPTRWKFVRWPLPNSAREPRWGGACLVEGDHLYVYGLFPAQACGGLNQPLALARVALDRLQQRDASGWEYWSQEAGGAKWSPKLTECAKLFSDAAPELSVGRVPGVEGYIATYTALGLSPSIMLRHAAHPAGPWSDPVRVYHCPEADAPTARGTQLMVYGAKAHTELSRQPGQLILTYSRNAGSLSEDARSPEIYFPQAVEVRLKTQP
jgi:hypothetical protein